MNYKQNKKKYNTQKYTKKIYFKNININHLKINILNILKKKFKYQKHKKNYLLSNDGIYTFNKDSLQKHEYISEILNETNEFIELNQFNKFKRNLFQIPFEHNPITVTTLSFEINGYILIFELVDNKINDFFIKTNSTLNILDILMIKEISYIKNLII